jgi:hypothetical protein
MGNGRGNAETGFIRSVNDAVNRFYTTVVVQVEGTAPRRTAPKERSGTG